MYTPLVPIIGNAPFLTKKASFLLNVMLLKENIFVFGIHFIFHL